MQKHLLLFMFMAMPFVAYSQLDCSRKVPGDWTWRGGNNFWMGYVFQLDPGYKPDADNRRQFDSWSDANRQYKGFLKYGETGLPANGINFDLNFGGGFAEDTNFFKTDSVNKSNDDLGCDVELKYFGVVLRAVYTIPAGQGGIYRFTIGSDDGSSLSVKRIVDGVAVTEVIHDNWNEGKTYDYNQNIINSYREYEAGERLELFLSYYEVEGFNRLSFHFERYFGPGEIEGSQDICRISPDPAPFKSKAPAVFAEGGSEHIAYQWQVTRDLDSEEWEDIPGATGLIYDIPRYPETATAAAGTWYYRRKATLTNQEAVPPTYSNELTVNIGFVSADDDREEFGENEWIGHVYKGLGNFDDPTFQYDAYLGRFVEPAEFSQNFTLPGEENSSGFLEYRYPIPGSCELVTTDFSIRYKMKLDTQAGVYTFNLSADDGVRLTINGQEIFNAWTDGRKLNRTVEYVVEKAGTLELILDYYEKRGDNLIEFSFPSFILPVEWGHVKAAACGTSNCLTWETMQEKNTSHFELERSYNGLDWEMFDNSIQAQGMSTQKTTYHFTDGKFLHNKVFYRIKQLDLDGTFDYSDIVAVTNHSFIRPFYPFPNPTVGSIRFFSKSKVNRLTVIHNDYSLEQELAFRRVREELYEVDLSGLKNGTYVVRVFQEDGGGDVFMVMKR